MPNTLEMPKSKLDWLANNLDDIKKITMSIIFIGGLGYATVDWLSTKFITKLEASNYALKQNVQQIDQSLAKTQLIVYQNDLYNARKLGLSSDNIDYYRSIDKRIFMLKIKLQMIEATEKDYIPKF